MRKKKRVWYVYLITLPVFGAIGWICGLLMTGFGQTYVSIIEFLGNAWKMPAKMGMALGVIVWFLFAIKFSSRTKNLEPGKEYGEARFAAVREILPKISEDSVSDKILSQNLHMSLNDKLTGLNASALIIGGSGSGKTFKLGVPNLLQGNSSFVFTDPKGTILIEYGNYLLRKGYQVKVIDLTNPTNSDCFNPFAYVRSNADIVKLVNDYIRATTPKNSTESDPFWSKSEAMLETALIQLMFVAYPNDCSMEKFLSLLHMCKAPVKDTPPSELDKLFIAHKDKEVVLCKDEISGEDVIIAGQRAYENYRGIMDSAEDTCRSVIISALARYDTISNSPQLIQMLSGRNSVDFRAIGTGYQGHMQKTALFVVSSDIDPTYDAVVLWVLSSLFTELYAAARLQPDDRLPIPVQIYLDEFANIPQQQNVLKLFATMRSRGISANAFVQSYGQLKGLFKDESENIQGSADTLIYLGSNEPQVHKLISEQLGKYTLSKISHSDGVGTHGSSSKNTDVIGKELLAQDRVRMLPGDKQIVMIRGYEPVIDDKYKTQDDPRFKEAMSSGKYKYKNHHNGNFTEAFGSLSEAEISYSMKHGAEIISFTTEELFDSAEEFTVREEELDLDAVIKIVQQTMQEEQELLRDSVMDAGYLSVEEML